MGNEQSHVSGIEIEEKAIEVSDFWSQHSATINNSGNLTNLTVFISDLLVSGPLWTTYTPLEKTSKVQPFSNFITNIFHSIIIVEFNGLSSSLHY